MGDLIKRNAAVIGMVVVLVLCGVLLATHSQSTDAPQVAATRAPASTTASTPATSAATPMPTVTSVPASDDERFKSLVLQFEAAYLIPDGELRLRALKPLVMPEYLDSLSTVGSSFGEIGAKNSQLTIRVIPDKSIVVSEALEGGDVETREVTAIVSVETLRGGTVVNAFEAPMHTSFWIKTTNGWKAIQDG